MSAIAGQTAGLNGLKLLKGTHPLIRVNVYDF